MSTTLFIGLGNMGSPMALLHARAFPTAVFDLSADAVAHVTGESPATAVADLAELPEGVDTVILMLPTSRHVERVLRGDDGLFARLPEGALVIDMGSSEPGSTRELAAEGATRSIDYVDAPVSGGVIKAVSGELAIMVGGADDAVARAMSHLEVLGGSIVHVGPAGAGDAAKALNNLVSASNIAVASEALVVAESFGIEPATMIEVLNAATGRSQSSELKFPRYVLTGTFDSGFAYDLMLKDITIAMGMTDGLDIPVTRTVFDRLRDGRPQLGDHPDHTEIARLYGLGENRTTSQEENE
ncbi:NAD(P)-dependent oxidoreductase [Microbacterium gorillae]|uniref:NAD(P)-dependent oxidoreductase n=1 Tax=Microbacterium gorillae TaxID=1231063 RepID=UPI00069369CC|nr:NAD(P)-dependent oxidoreductase [Microbacterium gorillae]